jgi:glycosyltransferase involved in cell wall biosynthesis
VILSIGALTWEKDPLVHLEVSRRLAQQGMRAIHIFVGDGPLRPELELAIRRLGLEKRTLLLGSRADIADIVACGDVLLLASCTEGMPATIVEAGVLGLPVVAFAVAGVPEVVIDGSTGLLAHPGDVQGLTDRVWRLVRDKAMARIMGERAARHCRRAFDVRIIAPQYLALYRELRSATEPTRLVGETG